MTVIDDETTIGQSAAGRLQIRIENKEATVGIIGLGYVGLPLALSVMEGDFRVIGFDVDREKIAALAAGQSYIAYIEGGRIAAFTARERFRATSDVALLAEADVVIICVPTPLTPQREPDLKYVRQSAEAVAGILRPGQLVVLESTTYPGTTDEVLREILDRSGLACGTDYFLAFSPEREDPGRANYSTSTIPKVVGGVDAVSGDLAEAFYSRVIKATVRVSSARAAEATKLAENIFRAINIALVNELKIVYDRLGIDIWEVLDAAETKPFGFMRFSPGPGWGGHCIPLDPFYLTWKAREAGVTTRFIELAGEINVKMPEYVIEKLMLALNDAGRAIRGSNILLIGLAYKKNIADARESPSFEILERLLDLGANLSYHDPHVPVAPKTRRHPEFAGIHSLELSAETLCAQDAVLIVTDHDAVDYAMLAEHASLVVDTRGVMRKLSARNGRLVQA